MTAVSFFVALGFGLIIPAIPIFAKSFGVSNAAIGLVISMFAITRLASGLVSGKLVERFGERFVLGSGLFMVAFFVFLTGLAQSYEQLLFLRAAGGLGSSMFSVASSSLVIRMTSDDKRGRAQSVTTGGFLVGGIAGPAFGGALIAFSPRAPFFIYSVTLTLAGLTGLIFLSEHRMGKKEEPVHTLPATTIREAFRIKAFRYALIMTFLTSWILFGVRSSILPLYVIQDLGGTTTLVGIGFTVGALAQGLILIRAGKFSDNAGRKKALSIGFIFIACGITTLILAQSIWFYLVAMLFLGIGGAYGNTGAALVGDVIKGRSGRVIAVFQMAGDAGMMVGPILLGFVSDISTYRTALIVSAIAFSIALFLVLDLPETRDLQNKSGSAPRIGEEPL
ncbi:MAG: MFS transporter [Actinobacteria bacterium]|nr:MFS transporter [Actinomycetota bacterium]